MAEFLKQIVFQSMLVGVSGVNDDGLHDCYREALGREYWRRIRIQRVALNALSRCALKIGEGVRDCWKAV